ncbi:ADP-ribose glycohydrolase OARD1 [Centropristis striata]|uniref:ADP-ribose glycohydrolase OARD1 n=1 Tax=Centropristis striata TaxID=184440 RepID=UPI0027DF8A5A|nr:ADP-ribose glycohydrolase OARD1 [Centropristis striata]
MKAEQHTSILKLYLFSIKTASYSQLFVSCARRTLLSRYKRANKCSRSCFILCSKQNKQSKLTAQALQSRLSMSSKLEKPVTRKIKPVEDSYWRLNYVTGSLFSCPKDDALAHCISEDCRMGAGIAVMFKKEFKGVEELKEQKKLTGECAVLKRDRRYVYYLITKKKATQKPTYDTLTRSLEDMRTHCVEHRVTRVSMPRIGCGLDKLQWNRVAEILEQVFQHTNISITVYSLPEKAETTVMKENMRR